MQILRICFQLNNNLFLKREDIAGFFPFIQLLIELASSVVVEQIVLLVINAGNLQSWNTTQNKEILQFVGK